LNNTDRLNVYDTIDIAPKFLTHNKDRQGGFPSSSTKTKSTLFSELSGFFQLNVVDSQLLHPSAFSCLKIKKIAEEKAFKDSIPQISAFEERLPTLPMKPYQKP
jgi:hypothetical protein